MVNITRRLVAGALAASPVAGAGPLRLRMEDLKKDTDSACLYHCDFADERRFSQMLDNIRNHLEAYGFDPLALRLVIVAHAAGIRFFLSDLAGTPWSASPVDPDIAKRMSALGQYGLLGYLCATTFAKNNLSPDRARPEPWLRMVPSGIATAGALQSKGYGYLKIG